MVLVDIKKRMTEREKIIWNAEVYILLVSYKLGAGF